MSDNSFIIICGPNSFLSFVRLPSFSLLSLLVLLLYSNFLFSFPSPFFHLFLFLSATIFLFLQLHALLFCPLSVLPLPPCFVPLIQACSLLLSSTLLLPPLSRPFLSSYLPLFPFSCLTLCLVSHSNFSSCVLSALLLPSLCILCFSICFPHCPTHSSLLLSSCLPSSLVTNCCYQYTTPNKCQYGSVVGQPYSACSPQCLYRTVSKHSHSKAAGTTARSNLHTDANVRMKHLGQTSEHLKH